MTRRREDLPLQKVTLSLYHGEFSRLQELYPQAGGSKIIRMIVHGHLRRIEERAAQSTNVIRNLDLDLSDI